MKRSLGLLLLVCVLTGCVSAEAGNPTPEDDTSPTGESSAAPSAPAVPPAEETAPVAEPAPAVPPSIPPARVPGGRGAVGPSPEAAPTPTKPSVPATPTPVAPPSGPVLGAPAPAQIDLGQTTDELGLPHNLALTLAPSARNAIVRGGDVFAVISGSRLSLSGDAAVDAWRFSGATGDATGDAAPIVVVKTGAGQTVEQLAAQPSLYTDGVGLNDDPAATSVRLSALVADAIAQAGPQNPHSAFYTRLATALTDPAWAGTLVFDATVSALPSTVGGPSAGPRIAAVAVGFTSTPASREFFGVVDYTGDPGGVTAGAVRYLRAAFVNNALTALEVG